MTSHLQSDSIDLLQAEWNSKGFDPQVGPALIAVSGGRDSMLLLHLWTKIIAPNLNHGVAMVDHGLRTESIHEACWLKKELKKFSSGNTVQQIVSFHFKRLDPKLKPKRMSVEDWGRCERYQFFKQIQSEYGYQIILTAHHLQDLIESFWISIYRGTGLKGLRGLQFLRNDHVCRPLLYCSKKQMQEWANDLNIEWIEDKTNADTSILRNWVRHHFLNKIVSNSALQSEQTILSICKLSEECYKLSESIWPFEWSVLSQGHIQFIGESFPIFESLAWILAQNGSCLTESRYQECQRQLQNKGRFDCSLDSKWRFFRTKSKFYLALR